MQNRLLVASAFEAELQPLAAASAAAALRVAASEVAPDMVVVGWDADLLPDDPPAGAFDLVALSVQQFEGLETALALAERLHRDPEVGLVVAFGQYAQMNSSRFLEHCDGVLFDEPERMAEPLLRAVVAGDLREVPGMLTTGGLTAPPPRRRITTGSPARDLFPSLFHYPAHHGAEGLLGNIEASRGCHHKCTYCSVFGAYDGGVAPYDIDSVLADARQLADEGVRHFLFIDAEFFNSRKAGPEVMRRIVDEVGPCTFEFTTRVDHIIDYSAILEDLVALGLTRITSALEFPSDRILRIFDKGIDVADMRVAIARAASLGVELRPTFIPFTPWIELDELLTFEDFLVETDLARVTHPTALQTRLLLFKGSPLLASPWLEDVRTVDRGLHVEWEHPDPRVDDLWQQRRDEAEGAGRMRCCVKC